MKKQKRRLQLVKKPAKTQALAKVDKYEEFRQMMVNWQQQRTQVIDTAVSRYLEADKIEVGQLGLSEIKLTEAEEAVLARPVPASAVRIKPTGQPYLPHTFYTKLFNEAFGRTGWILKPGGRPMKNDKSVMCAYVLFIHGVPVEFAWGEQDYYESNKEQTYGDATESTVASGLRRCAKHMGITGELWDRDWLREWIDQNAVRVNVEKKYDTDKGWAWRRVVDPPFWNELGAPPRRQEYVSVDTLKQRNPGMKPETEAALREGVERKRQQNMDKILSKDPITVAQRRRMFAMLKPAGRDELQFRGWLRLRYGWDSTKLITKDRYDEICAAIEAPGAWPGIDREPGQEG